MNGDILIGVAMLIIAVFSFSSGFQTKRAVSPRFGGFHASLVLYPPFVLVFVAGGFAEPIVAFLRAN